MNQWRLLLTAMGFLTRFPVTPADVSPKELGASIGHYPVVGLLIGGILATVAYVSSSLIPVALVAVLIVGFGILLTGALHLDGVADVADGLGAGDKDSSRALEAMRDSQVGSFGAIALVFIILAKTIVLSEVLGITQILAVLLMPVVARCAVVPLIAWLPYARKEGLGAVFNKESNTNQVIFAIGFTLVAIVLADFDLILPLLITLVLAMAFGYWTKKRLGGLTGDVYGAAIEMSEVVFISSVLLVG